MKHTPPDWIVKVDATLNKTIGIYHQFKKGTQTFSRFICALSVHGDREENEANARLIAAAPDLLAALESMVALFAELHTPNRYEADIQARAAIAKAKGEKIRPDSVAKI